MKIYRYALEENYTGIVHSITHWHTTLLGATTELDSKRPGFSEDEKDDALETVELIVD